MPNSSAMRYSSQRATHSWSATSSGPSGPTWNSHWPGMTSALMPEIDETGFEARVEVRLDDRTAVHLVGADAAVVEALRRGEAAAGGEAVRASVLEERVLLLDAEQRLVLRVLLRDRARAAHACS